MKNTSKLSLTELSKKTNVISKAESLNAIRGGETTIPISHGDEAGTPKGTPTPNPFPGLIPFPKPIG